MTLESKIAKEVTSLPARPQPVKVSASAESVCELFSSRYTLELSPYSAGLSWEHRGQVDNRVKAKMEKKIGFRDGSPHADFKRSVHYRENTSFSIISCLVYLPHLF